MKNKKETSLQVSERHLLEAVICCVELMMDDVHARCFAAHHRAQELLKAGAEFGRMARGLGIPKSDLRGRHYSRITERLERSKYKPKGRNKTNR